MRGGEPSAGVWRRLWRDWIKPAIIIASVVILLKSFAVEWNWVPTSSMKPTILEGDLVLVNKVAYDLRIPFTNKRIARWNNPARGDIVVILPPDDGTRMVKRVVAGPGDTIEMRRNVLYINGHALRYEVVQKDQGHEAYEDPHAVIGREIDGEKSRLVMVLPSTKAMRSFSAVKIPAERYFVMGDSRDNSTDSRYIGVVERKHILGRTSRVLFSFNSTEGFSPRFDRFFTSLD